MKTWRITIATDTTLGNIVTFERRASRLGVAVDRAVTQALSDRFNPLAPNMRLDIKQGRTLSVSVQAA